ncbi:MAG TPA: DUF4136 domain-containing protein [Cyclobacteriaceae bacterium]|jgi:hypothetical protein|nr:DUF4136 domain-containing protein [Cyclobacteriaceae bacterium]
MKTKIRAIALFGALTILASGCYPLGPEDSEELDIVVTNFRDAYDFHGKTTYARPDKIVIITGNQQEGEDPVFIPEATAALILAQIDENMEDLGYQQVDVSADPDLLLTPAAWETTTIVYWYDYWYWWWGGYYPGWGYYPGYYPGYVSAYSAGTLVMGLIDPVEVGANGKPLIQWTGAVNGILTGSYDASRISKAIDQAFDQSPYLRTN